MWSLTSPRPARINGPKKFRWSVKKDFCNKICTFRTWRDVRLESVMRSKAEIGGDGLINRGEGHGGRPTEWHLIHRLQFAALFSHLTEMVNVFHTAWVRSRNTRREQISSAVAQVFGCRHDEAIHALRRPASEKRQGTKSREVGHRRCRGRYGDLAAVHDLSADLSAEGCIGLEGMHNFGVLA
jgi:hypothetical protein